MAGRRQSVAYREGVVTRILADTPTVVQEDPADHSKSLSADWKNVLSQNRAPQIMTSFGVLQQPLLLGDQEPQEYHEERPTVHFCTGSAYTGQWNMLGMSGFGTYRMPHDVEYEGEIQEGVFHGDGTLVYPNGCKLFGHWEGGRMVKRKYQYPDGLTFSEHEWRYCTMPDRRFRAEHVDGLRPAGRSLKTQQVPTREIPEGCYDTGDGFYDPVSKCVMCPRTGRVIRIPNNTEDLWIKENCRRAWDENCGFRPTLYENWFDPAFLDMSDTSLESNDELQETGHIPRASDDFGPFDSDFDLLSTYSRSFDSGQPDLSTSELLDHMGKQASLNKD